MKRHKRSSIDLCNSDEPVSKKARPCDEDSPTISPNQTDIIDLTDSDDEEEEVSNLVVRATPATIQKTDQQIILDRHYRKWILEAVRGEKNSVILNQQGIDALFDEESTAAYNKLHGLPFFAAPMKTGRTQLMTCWIKDNSKEQSLEFLSGMNESSTAILDSDTRSRIEQLHNNIHGKEVPLDLIDLLSSKCGAYGRRILLLANFRRLYFKQWEIKDSLFDQ